jgi:ankyrin repeat domain-containing protein 50
VQTPARLLSGLWRQLVIKSGKLSEGVQALYQRKRGQDLTTEEVLRILTACCAEFQKVFLIIDALDECSQTFSSDQSDPITNRDRLLNALKTLHRLTNVNIMITSRPEVSITYTFPSAQILPIRATDDDISKYVTSRVTSVPRFLAVLRTSVGLEDLIRSTVVEKAGGVYVDLSIKFVFA